jgi:hypothetical protein
MTTRPQLASSPAIAVLTSGELATDSAIRFADAFDFAPVDPDLDELPRALAVAHHLMGEIEEQVVERGAEGGKARSPAS